MHLHLLVSRDVVESMLLNKCYCSVELPPPLYESEADFNKDFSGVINSFLASILTKLLAKNEYQNGNQARRGLRMRMTTAT